MTKKVFKQGRPLRKFDIEKAFKLYSSGETLVAISKELDVPRTTLARRLKAKYAEQLQPLKEKRQ